MQTPQKTEVFVMYKKQIWVFKQKDNFNTVRMQKDGRLSCDCVDFVLFGYCKHIRHVEFKYMKEEVIKVQCGAV